MSFPLPTADVLQILARGRLADRLLRAIRLWVILHRLYGPSQWAAELPVPFRYRHLRDRIFASSHGRQENLTVQDLIRHCAADCLCQWSAETCLTEGTGLLSLEDWHSAIQAQTGLTAAVIDQTLQQCPFSTVHRSLRDDLNYLVDLGWLQLTQSGQYCCLDPGQWPELPEEQPSTANTLGNLSITQSWDLLRSLEAIAFVQPELAVIIEFLREQFTYQQSATPSEPEQRIFIHLDYILSDELQEQVDTLQEQIEQLWRRGGGVIQFDYEHKAGNSVTSVVYPVCLHYARRAKYLSAYGDDPNGIFGWHNYRLDRIISKRLTLLTWNDPRVPEALLNLHWARNLPTVEAVKSALEAAWGFNFYLPRRLLIMRFPTAFALRYVHQTDRHPTFQAIAYDQLPELLQQAVDDPKTQSAILSILAQRNPEDAYYRAWIRLGDINIVMRLRDWRPNGEVIAPLELRHQMREEVQSEWQHYKI